tara:strand:+ start:1620 stop:2033 length:414 start_codon:yes stop_codon:yes gene_type:complete
VKVVNNMKMPISEIIDRYTITLLKQEKGCEEDISEEVNAYKQEIDKYGSLDSDSSLVNFIKRLKQANEKIWDLEVEGGRAQELEGNLSYEKIGRVAVQVRYWNRVRNGIKAEIVEKFREGFKEIKTNYTKTNYGWEQ